MTKTPTYRIIDLMLEEIKDFESNPIPLTDRVDFNQYEMVQTIKTHQNKGFLKDWVGKKKDEKDPREFYDIITPMTETNVVNTDIDTDNFDTYTLNEHHESQAFLAKSLLKNFFKQTTHGIKLNNIVEAYNDDGNVVVRKVKNELYEPVDLLNLYVIDQSAKTLEDTTVIEKNNMNQTRLRQMTEWKNIDEVMSLCNTGTDGIPYYEIFYRYGELSKDELNFVKDELYETGYEENDEDKNINIQSLVVMARVKTGKKEIHNNESKGVVVFAEELKPEIIKISKKLQIKKYKPYEEVHKGKYSGKWLREGDRQVGIPYQNRANELANQIRQIMKHLKLLYHTTDASFAGKNMITSIKDGQFITAKDLKVLNNVFPNLAIFAEEWNRNMSLAEKALKAFEVATGETMPSSASATAVAIQNQKVGLYFDFKREKLGLFFSSVFKRWVLPELLKNTDEEEIIEIIGDPSYFEQFIDATVDGWMATQYLKMIALKGGIVSPEIATQLKELKKQELMKRPALRAKLMKGFYKETEIYVDINITGENFNKQNRIVNGLKLVELLANPVLMQNPETRDIVIEIATSLGFHIKPKAPAPNQMPAEMPNTRIPIKEPSIQEQTLNV